MRRRLALSGAAVSLAAPPGLLLGAGSGSLMAGDQPDLARGEAIRREACAACRGADLEEEPNWRRPGRDDRLPAPPQDASGRAWRHPDQVLLDITMRCAAAVDGADDDRRDGRYRRADGSVRVDPRISPDDPEADQRPFTT